MLPTMMAIVGAGNESSSGSFAARWRFVSGDGFGLLVMEEKSFAKVKAARRKFKKRESGRGAELLRSSSCWLRR